MKTNLFITHVCLATLLLFGCKQQKNTEQESPVTDKTFSAQTESTYPHYFNGEFSLVNDIPQLLDCATGTTIKIKKDSIAEAVIAQYQKIKKTTESSLLGEFKGFLSHPNEIEKNQFFQLTIIDFIRFDTASRCNSEKRITGEYMTLIPNRHQPTDRFTLTLHPNYTYTFTIFNMLSNSTRKADGKWYQSSEDMIVLEITPLTNFQNKAYINYAEKELVFVNSKRVYTYQGK